MTSPKVHDVFLIIYLFVCTFTANGSCDNYINQNHNETYHKPLINGLTTHNQNSNKNINQIDFVPLSTVSRDLPSNYTSSTINQRSNIKCRCNTTKLSSEITPIVDCNTCHRNNNSGYEDSEQDDGNNKLFKLNYSRYTVNETIYLNVNFENLTDRHRRDVIYENLSTSQPPSMTALESSEENGEFMIDNGGYHLDTYGNSSCIDDDCIHHNITPPCEGDIAYCNYTYEEYVEMLYDYIYPSVSEWILIFSHAVVFFMGLVGNALVCISVYSNYTMRTVTNIFIVNLAVADFFVILFCLPPTVVWDVTETWFLGESMCKVVLYFQTVSVTVSVLTLTFISIDRWYAICFPLRYVSTNIRAVGSIAFIWMVALLSEKRIEVWDRLIYSMRVNVGKGYGEAILYSSIYCTLCTVSVTVSVLTLTFISIDRWYAICFPLRYVSTNIRAVGSIAFIWMVALLSDIPEFLFSTTKKKELRFGIDLFTQCVSTWGKDTEKLFYIARFIVLYVLPLVMMTVAYYQIVRVLWKSDTIPGHRESRNQTYTCGYLRPSGPAANSSTMGQLRARRKAVKMLVAVVVMFASCYFPVHVLNILRYTIDIGQSEIVTIFSLFSHWLCYANSAINPLIYNFMSGKFRREFRNALEKCRCGRVRVEDRSLYHSTPVTRLNNISPSSRSNYQLTSLRDLNSVRDRQTIQTSFVENGGNGHQLQVAPMLDDRVPQVKYDHSA